MGEKDNRFNIPKKEDIKVETEKIKEKEIKQTIETAKKEGWTKEELRAELQELKFNPDDIADRLAKKLLAIFQDMDKTPEVKPETKIPEQPQKIEIQKTEETKPKKGLFS